jgi:outer membrane protein OmpA-like peptidoglycan-associated protein
VANLDALTPGSSPVARPAAYANAAGLPPTAVVFFPGDGVQLNAEGRAEVRAAVEQFKAAGAQGFIRVVGHSSSRTANMSPDKHMEIIFRKSQERATSVAEEIIREGVPAAKVLVEAVGDSQPVYYESMPKGEDGNRRAEIFVQS